MNRVPLDQQQIDALMARAEAGDEDAQRTLLWLAEKWLFETMTPATAMHGDRNGAGGKAD